MPQRQPRDIWHESLDEGERRIARRPRGLAATGLLGGADVMIGVVAVVVVSGAVVPFADEELAHVLGSLAFGLAFVFIALGRSELFTENFLVPVATVWAQRAPVRLLGRMWAITLLFNLIGLAIFAAIFAPAGVLEQGALDSAGALADTFVDRSLGAAFLSAIAAGATMTLFTWIVLASRSEATLIAVSLLIGFLLAAPSLNHAVVSFGEILFGIFAGTSTASYGQLFGNLAVATAGNLVGGIGFVTITRLMQVSGEPDEEVDVEEGVWVPQDGGGHGAHIRDTEVVRRPTRVRDERLPDAAQGARLLRVDEGDDRD